VCDILCPRAGGARRARARGRERERETEPEPEPEPDPESTRDRGERERGTFYGKTNIRKFKFWSFSFFFNSFSRTTTI
jgi:hypothetical protein